LAVGLATFNLICSQQMAGQYVMSCCWNDNRRIIRHCWYLKHW